MRDRLIELMKQRTENKTWTIGGLADFLLANGVIVPPCKVGKTIYRVYGKDILEYTVLETKFDSFIMWFRSYNDEYVAEHKGFLFDETRIGKTVFLTKEEAERALRGDLRQ